MRTYCADKLKILADPTRLAVLQSLLKGPRHVSELVDEFDIEQSLLSHHLRTLRDADLVKSQRDGKSVLYALADEVSVDPDEHTLNLGCCRLTFSPDSLESSSVGGDS